MKNILSTFPDQKTLLKLYPEMGVLPVNGHLHTPFSFSAFSDIRQIFGMAQQENISVVGINDFFVTEGYEPFYQEALNAGVFPLFNIEFIGLMKVEQQLGIRINDPNNPGRCYFSGKGLDFPSVIDDRFESKLKRVIEESQVQVRSMIDKANNWFRNVKAGISLNYNDIRNNLAKELVRERHIAKAIRIAVFDKVEQETERISLFTAIFNGKSPKSRLTDIPGIENEIRSSLLKAGGKAFVEEDDNAFMGIDEIIEIIISAGGIPCYPVLLDDVSGNYTEYEKEPEHLWQELTKRKIGCIELIPGRNDAFHLEKYINFFHGKGFIILLGTEHNTPEMLPLTCDTRGKAPLSAGMQKISYEGACVTAAHQYLRARGLSGFTDPEGSPRTADRDEFIRVGNAVINYYLQSFTKQYYGTEPHQPD